MEVIDPSLLVKSAREKPLEIFLCGPGIGSPSFSLREHIKSTLMDEFNAKVHYGEDLDRLKRRHTNRVDLQTLEAQFAHTVDFTLLMLDSPGSIAELGTFSMISNIRPRLFVVVANHFYGAESYIARGPLSLVASYSPSNIIYYDPGKKKEVKSKLLYPVCLYKYAKHIDPNNYYANAIRKFTGNKFESNAYESYFNEIKENFIESATLAAINVFYRPTFAEIVQRLTVKPDDVRTALRKLMSDGKVEKVGGRVYRSLVGFSDPTLAAFNSTLLSRRRAELLATS